MSAPFRVQVVAHPQKRGLWNVVVRNHRTGAASVIWTTWDRDRALSRAFWAVHQLGDEALVYGRVYTARAPRSVSPVEEVPEC